jgi:methyltransferase (TIGR00027 family)
VGVPLVRESRTPGCAIRTGSQKNCSVPKNVHCSENTRCAQPWRNLTRKLFKDVEAMTAARTLIPRTRFIDSRLQAAIRNGIGQLVILGAGFDSRGYRFADALQNVRVFEVDQPDTQNLKIRRVREAIGGAPANLSYIPIDFRHERLGDVLERAGYRKDQRTFFIWEGVTMYLPAEAVRETLQWIASNSAAESSIVFDYTYEAAIRMFATIDLDKVPEAARAIVQRFLRLTAGEPWIFGLPDRSEKEYLSGLGLELRKVMGMNSAEAVESYLTRADGSIFGLTPATEQQGYLILEAAVPGN